MITCLWVEQSVFKATNLLGLKHLCGGLYFLEKSISNLPPPLKDVLRSCAEGNMLFILLLHISLLFCLC